MDDKTEQVLNKLKTATPESLKKILNGITDDINSQWIEAIAESYQDVFDAPNISDDKKDAAFLAAELAKKVKVRVMSEQGRTPKVEK